MCDPQCRVVVISPSQMRKTEVQRDEVSVPHFTEPKTSESSSLYVLLGHHYFF